MGGQQVVPAVMVGHLGCFAGQGDIDRLAAFLGEPCLRVELEYPYVSEICPVAEPQPPVRSHEESGVDAVAVFETVRTGDIYGLRVLEVRRFGIHGVVPHHVDPRLVSVAYASLCDGVDHEVAVSYLDRIGRDTATGTHCAALPVPAVFRQEPSASGSQCIVFPVTFDYRRRVVYVGLSGLGVQGEGSRKESAYGKQAFFHIMITLMDRPQESPLPGSLQPVLITARSSRDSGRCWDLSKSRCRGRGRARACP